MRFLMVLIKEDFGLVAGKENLFLVEIIFKGLMLYSSPVGDRHVDICTTDLPF